MKRRGILRDKKDNLVRDLKRTTLSFKKLGKKYGVSRQAIHYFSKKQGIKRPLKPRGHQIGECRLCQKLIQISKKPHSEFISFHTIIEKTGGSRAKHLFHLRTLRDRGLVSQRFGRLRSKRLEKAYAIYFRKRLPIRTIGRKVGLKNFPSVIRKERELGWNVPPSLYVYDGRERSRIQSEIQQKRQQQEDIARGGQEKFLIYRIRNIEICKISQNNKELNSKTHIIGITNTAVNDKFWRGLN